MRTIIIEDEPAILKELEWLVQQVPELTYIGSASYVKDALVLIKNTKPDFVIMDIQLYDGTSFDLLKQLDPVSFKIIFITAYNEFAIKAIKYGALDYLLKPIDEEEFYASLHKILQSNTIEPHQVQSTQKVLGKKDILMDTQICISTLEYIQVLNLSDIIYLNGDGAYTHFFLKDNTKITSSKPLKFYEDLLPESFFIRTHQSYVVNKMGIDKFLKTGYLTMKNKDTIPVATRRKEMLLKFLKSF